ncbi:pyrroline-5-carboxylate reductase [Fictibacillus macauensis ZFHKF-1]|uniref:Pyrroline-5-carboxylate reductase n=1 Tax=Fictibacillus macauensis ZFHKF-1 TaxID=1196324 RepID=I8ANC6_9BACL|nr:pyrroline-5-carboxylate reductase [Fictibacillus macauensis]EIT87294.1 pyrroline-5-carboxylate reductase [Fictibacillus macauensis ZFHKF-1]
MNEQITFIGAGAMAEALIAGLLKKGLHPSQVTVTNRNNSLRLQTLQQRYGVRTAALTAEAVANATIVLLAVKPKDVGEALQMLAGILVKDTLVLSVVAGISTQHVNELLHGNTPIIRAMPNTSAQIGYSATGLALGSSATNEHLQRALALFQCIGTTTVVSEEQLHAVTGLAGSGPAYIYYVVEAMQQAATELALSAVDAKELIVQTLLGAAHMLQQSGDSPHVLRSKVTSPGGTTEAGITFLENACVGEAITQSIQAAAARSFTLSQIDL